MIDTFANMDWESLVKIKLNWSLTSLNLNLLVKLQFTLILTGDSLSLSAYLSLISKQREYFFETMRQYNWDVVWYIY